MKNYYYFNSVFKYFYPTLTLKTVAFVTCWAVKKWGNARPYTKSRKKSEEKRCKNRKKTLGACDCLETEKPVSFSVVFGGALELRAAVKISGKIILELRAERPLPHCSFVPLPPRARRRARRLHWLPVQDPAALPPFIPSLIFPSHFDQEDWQQNNMLTCLKNVGK